MSVTESIEDENVFEIVSKMVKIGSESVVS